MDKCDTCGETIWYDKFPETDSICLCDESEIPISDVSRNGGGQ